MPYKPRHAAARPRRYYHSSWRSPYRGQPWTWWGYYHPR